MNSKRESFNHLYYRKPVLSINHHSGYTLIGVYPDWDHAYRDLLSIFRRLIRKLKFHVKFCGDFIDSEIQTLVNSGKT